MEANNRLAILKALLRDLTPHRLAVLKRLMFHLNRYVMSVMPYMVTVGDRGSAGCWIQLQHRGYWKSSLET